MSNQTSLIKEQLVVWANALESSGTPLEAIVAGMRETAEGLAPAKDREVALIVDGALQCPVCKVPTEIKFTGMIPSERSISHVDGNLVVVEDDHEDLLEGAEDEHLICKSCYSDLEVPEGYSFDFD